MGYLGNYRDLEQAAAEIQARLPAQLHARCGAAGRAARHWPSDSDSPFRLRPNYAVPSGLYGHPASARRATARRGRKLSVLLGALLFAASGAAQAKIITALSASLFDVNKAIDSAVDGDTVIIPAGTATWTSQLVITKAITLMGQTTTDSVAGTADDKTIIQCNFSPPTNTSLVKFQTAAGKRYHLSGFTFRDIGTAGGQGGVVSLNGTSSMVRIDHCNFDMGVGTPPKGHFKSNIGVGDTVYGVADHNIIKTPGGLQPLFCDHGGTDNQGFSTWADPTGWGTANFWFMEDNYIQLVGSRGVVDSTVGGREVIRHNHFHGGLMSTVHGTEGQTLRGNRAIEIYLNDAHPTGVTTGGEARSGPVLLWGNTWDKTMLPNFALVQFRQIGLLSSSGAWQLSGGSSPWDVNDNGSGSPVPFGQAGHQYFPTSGLGTVGAQTPSQGQLKDSGSPGWTTNQWVDFGVVRDSDGRGSVVNSNNADTLFLVGNSSLTKNSESLWTQGDKYSIHKVLVSIDQSGRGQSDLLKKDSSGKVINTCTNTTGVTGNCTANTATWPRQLLDPCYSWNNRQGTTHVDFSTSIGRGDVTLKANRDYYNEASPVSGVQKTGVGVGTLANRPTNGVGGTDITGVTTNPPGTAYWATDVNSVNGSSDKGALYVWRGGAWVLYYQPYTYPHPLVRDLAPPSNLRIAP